MDYKSEIITNNSQAFEKTCVMILKDNEIVWLNLFCIS
jgi:hypothetical protein